MLAVFTFVALWHDINLKLLVWGWLVVLFRTSRDIGNDGVPKEEVGEQADGVQVDLWDWCGGQYPDDDGC